MVDSLADQDTESVAARAFAGTRDGIIAIGWNAMTPSSIGITENRRVNKGLTAGFRLTNRE